MRFLVFLIFTSLSIFGDLPHRISVLKDKKGQNIAKSLLGIYEDYSASLLRIQIGVVSSGRHEDSRMIQKEFQAVNTNIRLIGKSYQFLFNDQNPLPPEAEIYRKTLNQKVYLLMKVQLSEYIFGLKEQQLYYLRNKDFVNSAKAGDEINLASLELEKIKLVQNFQLSNDKRNSDQKRKVEQKLKSPRAAENFILPPKPSPPLSAMTQPIITKNTRNLSSASTEKRFIENYENGQKKKDESYINGKKHGRSIEWYEDGEVKRDGTFKEGKKHGPFFEFFKNGERAWEGNFKNDVKNGQFIEYYSDGERKWSRNFKNGLRHGLFVENNPTGDRMWSGEFKYDKRDGQFVNFYPNGTRKLTRIYKEGRILSASARTKEGTFCDVTNIKDGSGTIVFYDDDGTEQLREYYRKGYLVEENSSAIVD